MREIPNLLSIGRLLTTVPLVVLVLLDTPWAYLVSLALFVLGAISDLLDGRLARRYKLVSSLGVFLDLTADKVYVSALLVALAQVGVLPAWLVVIIISREFIVSGLRALAASEGVVIPAGRWGKQKTAITMLGLAGLLLAKALDAKAIFPWGAASSAGLTVSVSNAAGYLLVASDVIMLLAVIWTIFSAVEYLVSGWPLLNRRVPQS
ncbi:MAG TPA: CDP-diacylglycerol--glycerol-3-phosphate 3-phosphatidyltransferase [Ktedonobacterales bacterium]|nr:CDP-diacylglycerol--glycerol-3-phosphate 3-phosphatidyltransferase [Ktedonobacterales bacterium]